MADETITAAATAIETPAAAPVEKKTRKPRTPKPAAETVAKEVIATPIEKRAKKTRAKSSKPATAKSGAAEPKKAITRAPRAKNVAPAASVDAIDDIAALITLEEENKQLRKELSEKLRSENADLRKRLGKA